MKKTDTKMSTTEKLDVCIYVLATIFVVGCISLMLQDIRFANLAASINPYFPLPASVEIPATCP